MYYQWHAVTKCNLDSGRLFAPSLFLVWGLCSGALKAVSLSGTPRGKAPPILRVGYSYTHDTLTTLQPNGLILDLWASALYKPSFRSPFRGFGLPHSYLPRNLRKKTFMSMYWYLTSATSTPLRAWATGWLVQSYS